MGNGNGDNPAAIPADQQAPLTKKSAETPFGDRSPNNAAGKLSQEAQQSIGDLAMLLPQQRPGQQRGETPAERAYREKQENMMKGQVKTAVGDKAPAGIQANLERKLSGLIVVGKSLAEIRGAMAFPFKDYYPPADQPAPRFSPKPCPPGQEVAAVTNWKEGDLARIGRVLKGAMSLYSGGQPAAAEAELAKLKPADLAWGQPIPSIQLPDGTIDKTGFWTAIDRKRVTIETAMDSNVGRIGGYAGTRYFQELHGNLQADARAAIQTGTPPENYNRCRDSYLGCMEPLVSSQLVPWSPMMEQAPGKAEDQLLDRMSAKFEGPSDAAVTARTLMDALQAFRAGDANKAKQLVESTTADGQRYAPWTASVINSDGKTINPVSLRNKVATLYDILNMPAGQRNDQALNRYVTVNLLKGVEAQLQGGVAPLEEVAFTMSVEQHIHNAHALKAIEGQADANWRKTVINRVINAQALTLRARNGLQEPIDQSAIDKLMQDIN